MAIVDCGYENGIAKTYTSFSAAVAAANGGTVNMYYSDANNTPIWNNISATLLSSGLTVIGAIPNRIIQLQNSNTLFSLTGTQTLNLQNVKLVSTNATSIIRLNSSTPPTVNVTSCDFIARGLYGILFSQAGNTTCLNCNFICSQIWIQTSGSVLTMKNCIQVNGDLIHTAGSNVYIDNCMFAAHTGITAPATGVSRYRNCIVLSPSPWTGTFDSECSNNASFGGTPPGANPYNLVGQTHRIIAYYFPTLIDFRVALGSSLINAGINVGLTSDIDGNAYAANTYPIGPSCGVVQLNPDHRLTIATPAGNYNAVNLTSSNVRTNIEFGIGTTGTITLPSSNDIRNGISCGANSTEVTGNIQLTTSDNIREGIGIGSNGTEIEGNIVVPDSDDIRYGVSAGSNGVESYGNLIVPEEDEVKRGVNFDSNGYKEGELPSIITQTVEPRKEVL